MIDPNNEEELYFAEQEFKREQEEQAMIQIFGELDCVSDTIGVEASIAYLQQKLKQKESE